jgi:molybdate transport system substrate-binding protein
LLNRRLVQLILAFLGVGLIASCGGNSNDDVPLIFAAASLSDVLTESAEVYERETGKQVSFSFGGSLALANQIAKLDAPADGVVLAGWEAGEILDDAGKLYRRGYEHQIFNKLVVIGPRDQNAIGSLTDLVNLPGRIAMGDPDLAPAGVFAAEALLEAEVFDLVSDRLVTTLDVRAALAAVESGNAQFGLVYLTDYLSSQSKSLHVLLELESGDTPIGYGATGIRTGKSDGRANEFINFILFMLETRNIFEAAGFELIAAKEKL